MKSHYQHFWRIAPCLFAIIVDYMGLGLVYPIVTAMFTEVPNTIFPKIHSLSSQDFYMGLAYVLYPLFMFFGASFLGDLSDIYGRKKVLILTMVGIMISFLLMSGGIIWHSLSLFLVGRAFSGLMAGSQPLCMAAIADLSTAATKAWNMSLVTLTNCVGLIIGPFIGGVFTEGYFLKVVGFPFPFLIAALMALVGLFLLVFLFKETFIPKKGKKVLLSRPITIFVEAFKEKKILFLSWIIFLQMLGFMLYYQTIGVYFRELFHYSSSTLGFFYGYMGVFFALGVLVVIPFVLKRWGVESIATWGFFVCGLFALLSVFYPNQTYLWLTVIPFAIGNAVGFTAFATIFSNSASAENQGWVMGVLASTAALSYIVAGFSTNLLPYFGSRGVIGLGGVSGVVSGLLLLFYSKKHSKISQK